MRWLALTLLVLSLLIGGARFFTGVIYLSDEPTAVLVLKRKPAMWIECPQALHRLFSKQIVLDREEPNLAYGRLYFPLMQAAPALTPVLLGAALLLLAFSRRGKARTRG